MTGLVEARKTMMIYSVLVIQNAACKARSLLVRRGDMSMAGALQSITGLKTKL
jgi:hypothetical protein